MSGQWTNAEQGGGSGGANADILMQGFISHSPEFFSRFPDFPRLAYIKNRGVWPILTNVVQRVG